jgi:pimeloyl-ACP methyl ester carboxylesterase
MDKEGKYADVNGTRLYYEILGFGQVLVLIHGFSLDCRQWNDQIEFFSKYFKVIAYDLRGFGRSATPTDAKYSHAEDLKALLDHLGIGKAHILGHSYGGRVSIAFAILYPDRTLSMIGADPALEGFDSDDPDTQELFTLIGEVWNTGPKSGVEAAKKLWYNFKPMELALNNPTVSGPLRKIIDDYSGWHWINEDMYQPLNPPAIEQLPRIKSPVLLLIGELNQSIYHLVSDFMMENIANSKREFIIDTAHMSNMEDPDQFNSKLLKFLQEINNS